MNKRAGEQQRDAIGLVPSLILALTTGLTAVAIAIFKINNSSYGETPTSGDATKADFTDADAAEALSGWLKDVEIVTLEDPRKLLFTPRIGSETPTEIARKAVSEITTLARIVRRVFQSEILCRRRLFQSLHSTASFFKLKEPNLDAIFANIEEIKVDVVDEFSNVRDNVLKKNLNYVVSSLFVAFLGFVLIALSKFGAYGFPPPDSSGAYNVYISTLCATLIIPFGVAVGQYIEYVFSTDNELSYADIIGLNPGRWRPHQRFTNNVITAYVFAFMLGMNFLKVGASSVLLNDFFTTQPILSLAVGFISGFTFPVVRDLVSKFKTTEQK